MKLILPIYDPSLVDEAIAAFQKSGGGIAIVNPDSGVGRKKSSLWAASIRALKEVSNVVGYIDCVRWPGDGTRYNVVQKRNATGGEIKGEIADWDKWYKVTDIFYDEAHSLPVTTGIGDVLNPGTRPPYKVPNGVACVTHENRDYLKSGNSKIITQAVMCLRVPNAKLKAHMDLAMSRDIQYFYATDLDGSGAAEYSRFPPYLMEMARAAKKLEI
jgi:Spherulation-specific family 4